MIVAFVINSQRPYSSGEISNLYCEQPTTWTYYIVSLVSPCDLLHHILSKSHSSFRLPVLSIAVNPLEQILETFTQQPQHGNRKQKSSLLAYS